MPKFPKGEAEVIRLAELIVQGLIEEAEDLPAPPMGVEQLTAKLAEFVAVMKATVLSDTASKEQHALKDRVLTELTDGMKADIRYAEAMLRSKPEKLTNLGWNRRRAGSALEAPGEVRDIILGSQGDTWLSLRWNAPIDGGAAAFYKIQRKREGTPWEDVGTATVTEHMVISQPRGVELTYQVVAVNKAGQGNPSGVVTAVL